MRPPGKVETVEQARLHALVENAKKLSVYPGVNWDDLAWDVTSYEKPLAHSSRQQLILYFSPPRSKGSARISYEQSYADFAKTIIRTRISDRGGTFAGQSHMMLALRYLYAVLRPTGTADPTKLTRGHFKTVVTNTQKIRSEWTTYHIASRLQEISDWLDNNSITRMRVNFTNPIPCPPKADGLDPESQAKGLKKMPSANSLEVLADITNYPVDDNERILLRIIDLLVVGGFRIGEVLRLPVDCWVETPALDQTGKTRLCPSTATALMRYGIRYWPEKGGDPIIKWVPDIAVQLARRAVEDLKRLCADARAAAKVIEQNPDRVPFTNAYRSEELIDLKQVMKIFGLRSVQSARRFIVESIKLAPIAKKKSAGRRAAFLFRVGDIEKALLRRRKAIRIIQKPNGQVQMLSESLCVMFQNQFFNGKPVFRFLPELIGVGQIAQALGNDGDEASVFSIRGITEPDGSRMKIKTHAFRHWINTLMARGGLSDIELARWSGRRDVSQNATYKHGTVEQRIAWAREMIKAKELKGVVADTYHAIADPIKKQDYLDTFVNVAHFTPFGVCMHDYAIDPCPYHLNCLRGCPEYLRTKGDQEERKNIAAILDFHLVQLQRSNTAEQQRQRGAGNYSAHNQLIVEGARAALAVDDDSATKSAFIKVFPTSKGPAKQQLNN